LTFQTFGNSIGQAEIRLILLLYMNKKHQDYIFGKEHFKLSLLTLVITLITIAIFALIGYSLDYLFGTDKILTVIGVVISYPVNQLILNKVIRKI
jgi:cell shape-determining protein MreD